MTIASTGAADLVGSGYKVTSGRPGNTCREQYLKDFPMRTACVVLLLIFSAGCDTESAGISSSESAAPGPLAKWEAYNPQDQTFGVEFPGTPERWTTEFESDQYGHTDVYHVSTEFDGTMYGVAYNDSPRDLIDAEAQSELKNALSLPGTGAEILATKEVDLGNIAAVEVISKTGPLYMIGRYFISEGRRLYSLHVGPPRDLRNDREMTDRFFESLRLSTSSAETD